MSGILETVYLEEDESEEESEEDSEEDTEDKEHDNFNIPLGGTPLYPRVFVGDSAKPLQGQFHESEYVDDNITRTWTGLLTSYYG